MSERFLSVVVGGLLLGGAAIGVLLVVGQEPFAPSRFEFQEEHAYSGVIRERPYPTLVTGSRQFLLVNPGKHGADPSVRGLDGRLVSMKGLRIERDRDAMLEVVSGSIAPEPAASPLPFAQPIDMGGVSLAGEIVDSKCFLGVMNPGNGKVHRDCAARCISGGVPPAFLVRDAGGRSRIFLLVGSDGRALQPEVLDYVAEPIRIRGHLERHGSFFVLKAEPKTFTHPE